MIQELKTVNEENMDDNTLREVQDKLITILKAVDLLSVDLLHDISDEMTEKYFHGRIEYLFGIAGKRDITLITHSYLRNLYTIFSNYYIQYQTSLPGDSVAPLDKERHLIYTEIAGRLEDMLMEH